MWSLTINEDKDGVGVGFDDVVGVVVVTGVEADVLVGREVDVELGATARRPVRMTVAADRRVFRRELGGFGVVLWSRKNAIKNSKKNQRIK